MIISITISPISIFNIELLKMKIISLPNESKNCVIKIKKIVSEIYTQSLHHIWPPLMHNSICQCTVFIYK